MKNTTSETTKLSASTEEGWSIHVYDRERRLRCTIERSHIRALGIGVAFGALITLAITNLNLPISIENSPTQTIEQDSGVIKENYLPAPIQID